MIPSNQNPLAGKQGPLLIAEIGGNHEGDFDYACELTRLALASGADAVKFQLYKGDTLVNRVESPDRHKHFQRFELSKDQHIALAEMVIAEGADYLASVWDMQMLEWIDPYLNYYKVGSGDLTAWPILASLAKREKPIILSTGLSTFEEVAETVEFIRQTNNYYSLPGNLAVLQCTSMYPIEHRDANLRVMQRYRDSFGCMVGYSDHTTDSIALETAVALGANVLEFHFTDTREGKSFRDHSVSLTCDEVIALRDRIQRITQVLGSHEKVPLGCEVEAGHVTTFRRGAYMRKKMEAGAEVTDGDWVYLRPNHGIDARDSLSYTGRKLVKSVDELTPLDNSLFGESK